MITTWNNPNVRKMAGSAISSTTGLMNPFMSPITAPAINSSDNLPSKMNPGTNFAAINMAAELAKILMISLMGLKQLITLTAFGQCKLFLMIICFSLKTLLPETFILGFFLSRFSALVFFIFIIIA